MSALPLVRTGSSSGVYRPSLRRLAEGMLSPSPLKVGQDTNPRWWYPYPRPLQKLARIDANARLAHRHWHPAVTRGDHHRVRDAVYRAVGLEPHRPIATTRTVSCGSHRGTPRLNLDHDGLVPGGARQTPTRPWTLALALDFLPTRDGERRQDQCLAQLPLRGHS
jgi:hypothetical protein